MMKDYNKYKIMNDKELISQIETIITSALKKEISSNGAFDEILYLIKSNKSTQTEQSNNSWNFTSTMNTTNNKPQYVTILDLESI